VGDVSSNTNLLVNSEEGLQRFTAMTRSSGIPVKVS